MKSKLFLPFIVASAMLFGACGSEEMQSERSVDGSSIVSDIVTEVSDNTAAESEAAVCLSETESFQISAKTGTYEFFSENSTGSYSTEFSAEKTDEGSMTVTLTDGRRMNFNYGEIVYDETEKIYKTEINQLEFLITEFYTESNALCQVLECIEPIEGFVDKVISTIIVTYYPELEHGRINMTFLYECAGNEYTIYYPDGSVMKKTVMYNSENKEYYFEE